MDRRTADRERAHAASSSSRPWRDWRARISGQSSLAKEKACWPRETDTTSSLSSAPSTSRHDASWWMHRAVAAVPNDHLETGRSRLTSAKAWMCDGVRPFPFGASACDQFRSPSRSTRAALITSDHSVPAPQNPAGFTARVGSIPTSGTKSLACARSLAPNVVIRRSTFGASRLGFRARLPPPAPSAFARFASFG